VGFWGNFRESLAFAPFIMSAIRMKAKTFIAKSQPVTAILGLFNQAQPVTAE
jgi:hypothetical protein